MQEMIERIVEMDRKARELTAEANALRMGADQEIDKKKQTIRKEYLEKARKRISTLRKDEQEHVAVTLEEYRKNTENIIAELEKKYQAQGNEWVGTIVSRVTGR